MRKIIRIGKKTGSLLLGACLILAVGLDLVNSAKLTVQEGVFRNESDFPATVAEKTVVAVVPSDDPSLPSPIPTTDSAIGYKQIEDMVRRAIELQGGLNGVVEPGDSVLIKPNIVDDKKLPGSGEVTDVQVVKALIKILHEYTSGNVHITIGEGAPRPMSYESVYTTKAINWKELWDMAGYPGLFSDPDLAGVSLDTLNLNGSPPEEPWRDLVLMDVPGGGVAAPQHGQYFVHKAVKESDVYISCPVLKIHNPGITNALKNQIGLAACTQYGYPKTSGVPQNGYSRKLLHALDWPRDWTDEEIVDLSTIAHIDFVVVDAIVTLEKQKGVLLQNGIVANQVRFNTIIAGKDPVAVDHVCAKLVGINPDDVDHICLAEKVGLGTNHPDSIRVAGADVNALKKRLRKKKDDTQLIFGRSNREWLLSSPFPTDGINDPIHHEFILGEAALEPAAGQEGWSTDSVYFFDDRIDLGSYYGGANNTVSYAFTYFTALSETPVELWIGSDEAVIVYLNHVPVYEFTKNRLFPNLYSERIPVKVREGENTLLVKTLQKFGNHDFSLNLCEVETDPELIGNRIEGLTFHTAASIPSAVRSQEKPARFDGFILQPNYPNPFNAETKFQYSLPEATEVRFTIFNVSGIKVFESNEGRQEPGFHTVTWNANESSSGLYLVEFRAGSFKKTQKCVLSK